MKYVSKTIVAFFAVLAVFFCAGAVSAGTRTPTETPLHYPTEFTFDFSGDTSCSGGASCLISFPEVSPVFETPCLHFNGIEPETWNATLAVGTYTYAHVKRYADTVCTPENISTETNYDANFPLVVLPPLTMQETATEGTYLIARTAIGPLFLSYQFMFVVGLAFIVLGIVIFFWRRWATKNLWTQQGR